MVGFPLQLKTIPKGQEALSSLYRFFDCLHCPASRRENAAGQPFAAASLVIYRTRFRFGRTATGTLFVARGVRTTLTGPLQGLHEYDFGVVFTVGLSNFCGWTDQKGGFH